MEENEMRKKLKSIIMIFASILLCGSNMLSTITIKANVTNLEDTGYWHSGQAHNPDILRIPHGSIIKRLKRSMSNKVSVYVVSLGRSSMVGVVIQYQSTKLIV